MRSKKRDENKEILEECKQCLKFARKEITEQLLYGVASLTVLGGTELYILSDKMNVNSILSKENRNVAAIGLGVLGLICMGILIKIELIPAIKNYKLVKEHISDDMRVINPNDEENKVKKMGEM